MKRLHEPIYHRRLEVLTQLIVELLKAGDQVLDIGCGSGKLGESLLSHASCPEAVVVKGLETVKRGGEPIEVIEYESGPIPLEDDSVDVVIFADVLHHEKDESFLLREAARVAKRLVIIKDHKPHGFLGYQRICFIDWAANNPYGVPCLYRYHAIDEWHSLQSEVGLELVFEKTSIDLYPFGFNFLFGKALQYFAVLKPK